MYKNMLNNIYEAAVKNNQHYRSDGSAMEIVNITLNNYKIDINKPNFDGLTDARCLKLILQIITELRHGWKIALDFYQESTARDCKNLLMDIDRIEGVYDLEDRMVATEISDKEYEWYKEAYGLRNIEK